jgi:hypothetical protein
MLQAHKANSLLNNRMLFNTAQTAITALNKMLLNCLGSNIFQRLAWYLQRLKKIAL